jgi:hypothetical protein
MHASEDFVDEHSVDGVLIDARLVTKFVPRDNCVGGTGDS